MGYILLNGTDCSGEPIKNLRLPNKIIDEAAVYFNRAMFDNVNYGSWYYAIFGSYRSIDRPDLPPPNYGTPAATINNTTEMLGWWQYLDTLLFRKMNWWEFPQVGGIRASLGTPSISDNQVTFPTVDLNCEYGVVGTSTLATCGLIIVNSPNVYDNNALIFAQIEINQAAGTPDFSAGATVSYSFTLN